MVVREHAPARGPRHARHLGAGRRRPPAIDFGYLDFVNDAVADCIDEAAAYAPAGARLLRHREQRRASRSAPIPRTTASASPTARCWRATQRSQPATDGRIVDPQHRGHAGDRSATRRSAVLATLVNFAQPPGEPRREQHARSPPTSRTTCAQRIEAEYGGLAIWVERRPRRAPGAARHRRARPRHGRARAAAHVPLRGGARRRSSPSARSAIDACASTAGSPRKNGDPSAGSPSPPSTPVAVPLDNPFFRFFIAIGVLDVAARAVHGRRARSRRSARFPPPFDPDPAGAGRGPPHRGRRGPDRPGERSRWCRASSIRRSASSYRARMARRRSHTFIVGPRQRRDRLSGAVREVGRQLSRVRAVHHRRRAAAVSRVPEHRLQHRVPEQRRARRSTRAITERARPAAGRSACPEHAGCGASAGSRSRVAPVRRSAHVVYGAKTLRRLVARVGPRRCARASSTVSRRRRAGGRCRRERARASRPRCSRC